ncbi:MAG: hypothetical protein E6G93_06875 [Alphaproteobacteria bacterium]|nr:MAG: hypothetical protein E6G93_06875 [Alphaproteobacteria bacterium]TMK49902.1 MAG: hypothetical protein E6G70_07585 [Alphaproteobacteria bacterium]
MSQISTAIFGAMAVSLTVGAVQFASGHDLTGGLGTSLGTSLGNGLVNTGLVNTGLGTSGTGAAATAPSGINRAAKADRAAAAVASSSPTRTISIRLDSLADTSVVIRIPVTAELRNAPASPALTTPADRELTACEPVVSTLTEVAKLLRPGRCVT